MEEPIEPQIEEEKPKKHSGPSVARTFSIVAILSLISKVAGLIRDIVVTWAYGTSIIADAYNYALLFTGNILVLFGGLGGPFHSATVAVLTNKKDDPRSGVLLGQIIAVTFAALTVIATLIFLLAPWIVSFYAKDYDPEWLRAGSQATAPAVKNLHDILNLNVQLNEPLPADIAIRVQSVFQQQMTEMLQLMSPLIVVAGLIGVVYGILNVYHKVVGPSLAPSIASLAIIIAVLLPTDHARLSYGIPLAIGTLAGGLGQFLVQLPSLLRLHLKLAFSLRPDPGLSTYGAILWPALISTSMGELTSIIDSKFAVPKFIGETGAWTAIVNANRLVQLPLGILGTAMLVPMLPRFTQQVAENRLDDLRAELRRALSFLWFLALPTMAIFIAVPSAIISLLFERGNFTAESTAMVTTALVFLVPSIAFYVARDLLIRVFFAFHDSRTPFYVALIALGVKAAFNWILVVQLKLGIAGMSISTSLLTVFNLTLLSILLRKKLPNLGMTRLIKPVSIMALASVVTGFATKFIHEALQTNVLAAPIVHNPVHELITAVAAIGGFTDPSSIPMWVHRSIDLFISLSVASVIGLLLYVLVCLLFKLEEPRMVAVRLPIIKHLVK